MNRRNVPALEVREDITRVFNKILDWRLQRMVITRHRVHGYAFSESGRQVITWSEGLTAYWALTRILRPFACRLKPEVARRSGEITDRHQRPPRH
jgi:hypothetical protein